MPENVLPLSFNDFLTLHESQLRASGVPGHFWKRLHEKLLDEIYDAHLCLSINRIEYETAGAEECGTTDWQVVVNCEELKSTVSNNIYLIDHAWTFDLPAMKASLIEVPALLKRMVDLFGITDLSNKTECDIIDTICRHVWKFCHHYKVTKQSDVHHVQSLPELQQLRWYVLDEVGSRIAHSDEPTARVVPFFYIPRNICYSILWPIKDLQTGDDITVDYIENITDASLRPYHLIPWQPEDFSGEPTEHTYVFSEEFFQSHRMKTRLPQRIDSQVLPGDFWKPLRVHSDTALVRDYLTDPRFSSVDCLEEAQILWHAEHFANFEQLTHSGKVWINQFPFEQVLTVKDLLAAMVALWHSSRPPIDTDACAEDEQLSNDSLYTLSWYPRTFNLVHEVPQFVAYFQHRQKLIEETDSVDNPLCSQSACPCQQRIPASNCIGEGTQFENDKSTEANGLAGQTIAGGLLQRRHCNLWILKPWNLGRSCGITISDQLDRILAFSRTGPLIASRYVTDPVLFYREDIKANVKFDIRYVVLVRSVSPLRLFVYKVFWLRFANKPFRLSDFDDYATHFTVMNYREDEALKQIHDEEFVKMFDRQYPNTSWCKVQEEIFAMLLELFKAATSQPAPQGVSHCAQSRAMYAVDLLLEWIPTAGRGGGQVSSHRISPLVCEVNFAPDCQRACRYHPDFYNHVFACLFLDEPVEKCNVIKLC